jgi:hypothetical protein
MEVIVLSPTDRYKTVAFVSALVSIGIITIEEFVTVMAGIEDSGIEEGNVSESFLLRLTEFHERKYRK